MDIPGESPPTSRSKFRFMRRYSERFLFLFLFLILLLLRPTCQWFKDSVKLTEKTHQINNKERTLTFKNASPDDNGLYYCCAKNAAGHVCSNTNYTLNIIGVCVTLCNKYQICKNIKLTYDIL